MVEGEGLRRVGLGSVADLRRCVERALARNVIVLTLRRQDSVMLRRCIKDSFGIVSLNEVLEGAGIEDVGGAGRLAALVALKRKGEVRAGFRAEGLFKGGEECRDVRLKYVSLLSEKGVYDVPLRLPKDAMERYMRGRDVVLVAPNFLRFDEGSLDGVVSEVLVFTPPLQGQGVAKVVVHRCANIVHQARLISSLEPQIVAAPSVSASLLSVYEEIKDATMPQGRFLFYAGGWREGREVDGGLKEKIGRFGVEADFRSLIFGLRDIPVCDWEPKEGRMLLCPVEDVPLVPYRKSVLLGAVQSEVEDSVLSKALHFIWALTVEEFHIFTYMESEGKKTFLSREVSALCSSGIASVKEEETAYPYIFTPRATEQKGEKELKSEPLYSFPLSPSSLEAYLQCPRRFFYRYIMRLPEEERPQTMLGSIIHKVLELHHSGKLKVPFQEEVKRLVQEVREKFSEGERVLIENDAIRLIGAYLESDAGEVGETVGVERKFRFEMGGLEIEGRIDRIARGRRGFVAIDYKTRGEGKERKHINRLDVEKGFAKGELDFQVPLYIEAMRRWGMSSIEGFCYIYLDFQKTWKPYRVLLPYDKIEFCVGEVLKKAVEVGKAIRADSEFKRRGGVVCRSSYSYPCPYLEICTESEVGGERDEFD